MKNFHKENCQSMIRRSAHFNNGPGLHVTVICTGQFAFGWNVLIMSSKTKKSINFPKRHQALAEYALQCKKYKMGDIYS